jgi:hypothetical protein
VFDGEIRKSYCIFLIYTTAWNPLNYETTVLPLMFPEIRTCEATDELRRVILLTTRPTNTAERIKKYILTL